MLALSLLVVVIVVCAAIAQASLPDVRPAVEKRTFNSEAINSMIDNLLPYFADTDLGRLFSNCLPNTLDTTVFYHGMAEDGTNDLDSFVITGDIKALWLRDSANQVIPYIPYASADSKLSDMIHGLINRQAKSILINPFANSFNYNASGDGAQSDITMPRMTPSVFENKYEIDSISAFLKLSYWHWQYTGDETLTSVLSSDLWLSAAESVVDTISTMQADDGTLAVPHYKFQRVTAVATDTLYLSGRGPPGTKSGLSRSLFRPSDDAVTLPYNIPGNAMACVELKHLQEVLTALKEKGNSSAKIDSIFGKASSTASTLCAALGDVLNEAANKDDFIIPYEVDGGRGKYFMDDANVPSLLSLPVLGFMSSAHPLYKYTREYVLSEGNVYFFAGSQGEGIGGPHVGLNYAWPMAITMRAMTSLSDEEISACLSMLVKSSAGTGLMHESFNVDNVNDFTRSWFAWANGLFGELVLQLIVDKPHLVLKGDDAAIKQAQSFVNIPVSLRSQKETIVNGKK